MEGEAEDHEEQGEIENVEQLLDGLGLGEDNSFVENSKKDSTVFLVDCSEEILQKLQGQDKSQLQLIFEGYYNFLQRKIIASASDRVGLILYNVKNTNNGLNQNYIYCVHSLKDPIDALRIKQTRQLFKEFNARFGGIAPSRVPLNYVLWEYGNSISEINALQYYLRVFLFTAEDCPHASTDENRLPTVERAKQLATKGVQIELFPLRKTKKCSFDIRKFYQDIISFDPDQINSTVLDSSSKILDLQERLRQKQFKKRTLNRLTMKIGREANGEGFKDVNIAVKIYSLFTKAKKPAAKKLQAKSNKLLQRSTRRVNSSGEVLFEGNIGTYYPLGGEKIKLSKEDMNKIKNLEPPGITLVGFKPRALIKPYYNLRTSYFLYPDEEHISGSSQFFDALIGELTRQALVGIVKIVPRNNQQLRFAALFPQAEHYDEQDHFQTPPGFHMVVLPYAEDIVSFVGDKTKVSSSPVSQELVNITKLLINNLTIHDFDFRNFENPALQKFYSHLQALALNEDNAVVRPDLLQPDAEGFENFKDIIEMVAETARMDAARDPCNAEEDQTEGKCRTTKRSKVKEEQLERAKSRKHCDNGVKQEVKEEEEEAIMNVEQLLINGRMKELKVADLRNYLRINGLDDKGKKEELIDRIIVFIEQKNSI